MLWMNFYHLSLPALQSLKLRTLKTVSNEETDNNKLSKKDMRKYLHNPLPSSSGKESLVGTGRTWCEIEEKSSKPEQKFDKMENNLKKRLLLFCYCT
ncbi:hypothetical protein QTP88_007062 [Uroleucon formosanum]